MNYKDRLHKKLADSWRRLTLHGVHYSNKYGGLNRAYIIRNPWRLDSEIERYRFEETNRIIRESIGRVGSLLEVGCGEGHQSLHLKKICAQLTGLDVSRRAVNRARRKDPDDSFIVGDLFSEEVATKAPYDLAVACEVLYYIKDVPASLKRLNALAGNCLVSYLYREIENLDPLLLSMPIVKLESIEFEGVRWRIAWWHSIKK